MLYPKTKVRNLHDITISWENIYGSNKDGSCLFKVEICSEVKQWKTLYFGPKTELKVDKLAPCTCYSFRIRQAKDCAEIKEDDWLYFGAATADQGPYTAVIHMTRAVRLGKTSVIRKIAHIKPLLLNIENKDNKTPIFQAIEGKDLQILHLLITLGANVNKALLHTKRTPLMFAIYKGELQTASFLIDKDSVDLNGLNIVHYAVDSNNLNSVKFAVETGVDFDLQDCQGWTPLMRTAILQSKPEIVEYLTQKGASKALKDRNGFDYQTHVKISNQKF